MALELSFVNSNLQLLKEQLAELNSSVEVYQVNTAQCITHSICNTLLNAAHCILKCMQNTTHYGLVFTLHTAAPHCNRLCILQNTISTALHQAGEEAVVPMIPLGLKETKELEVADSFRGLIQEHYYEDSDEYEEAIAELTDLRQVRPGCSTK